MQRFILRRLAQSVLLLFVLALIVFAMARVSGNPADLLLREDATQEDRAHLLQALGLDRPVHEQLYLFISGAVRGDLGESIRYRKPATEVFFERLPNTLRLLPLATERVPAGEVVRYHIRPKLGLFLSLLVTDVPDTRIWILPGEAPAFLKAEGPLYFMGPIWRVEPH